MEEKAEGLAGEEREAGKGLGPYGNPGTAMNSELDPLSGGVGLLPVVEAEKAASEKGNDENEDGGKEEEGKKDE